MSVFCQVTEDHRQEFYLDKDIMDNSWLLAKAGTLSAYSWCCQLAGALLALIPLAISGGPPRMVIPRGVPGQRIYRDGKLLGHCM